MNGKELGPIARRAAGARTRETDAEARIRAEYENSPEYRAGCGLLDGLTAELGISAEQAAGLFTNGKQPESMDVLCRMAAATLAELDRAGKLSRPVNAYLEDEAFTALLTEMPASAAVRVFEAEHNAKRVGAEAGANAEQDMLEKMRARRALPTQLRGNAPVSAEPDFAHMTGEEFERFKQRYFSR